MYIIELAIELLYPYKVGTSVPYIHRKLYECTSWKNINNKN